MKNIFVQSNYVRVYIRNTNLYIYIYILLD